MFPFLLRFQSRQTILQVGAYTGDDALIEACRRWGHRLYMFEPNRQRAGELRRKAGESPHIQVIQKAVSNYNGRAQFHIAAHDDCSSLQDFDASAQSTWVHEWHPYKRFEMVGTVEVDVIRLDTFLAAERIDVVDQLEIDAQGEDLRVAESLGERARDVKRIQIEVNISGNPLYRDAFTKPEALEFFERRNFEPHVSWKQSINREENIVFRNRRFYPDPLFNRISSAAEQQSRSLYFTALKAPRFFAVTRMMLARKIRGGASA